MLGYNKLQNGPKTYVLSRSLQILTNAWNCLGTYCAIGDTETHETEN